VLSTESECCGYLLLFAVCCLLFTSIYDSRFTIHGFSAFCLPTLS
jgi:hypothetical protein